MHEHLIYVTQINHDKIEKCERDKNELTFAFKRGGGGQQKANVMFTREIR